MERIGLVPGTEIGGYTIVAPLGAGGMGAVYRAADGAGAPVALKLLHPHVGADPHARDRLRREVLALQRLRHPGVAAVLDAEADSTEAFLVTELVAGRDLEATVRADGPLEPVDVALLAEGLLAALRAVHDAGVVHRDLKPSNVMVTPTGPVLIDFGIAQSGQEERVTSTGLVVGTPGYLAPELLDGGEPTPGSDLWGWAAVVAFAAVGTPPFGRGAVEVVLGRTRAGEPVLPGAGPRLRTALARALDPDPAARPPADALVAALHDVALAGDPEAAPTQVVAAGATTVLPVPPPAVPPAAVPAAVVAPPAVGPHDGSTRAFPVGAGLPVAAAAAGPAPAWRDEGPAGAAADGQAGEGADERGDEGLDEPAPYARPRPRRRWGSVLALGVAAAAGAGLRPVWVVAVVAVLLVLVRTVGSTVEALHGRRERRGVRRSDGAAAVGTVPWHLLRALLGVLPALVVGVSVLVIALGVLWWLLGTGAVDLPGVTRDADGGLSGTGAALAVAAGTALALVVVWFGPLSRLTRLGARLTLGAVAPGRAGAAVVVLVGLAAAAVLVGAILNGEPLRWDPLPAPTLP